MSGGGGGSAGGGGSGGGGGGGGGGGTRHTPRKHPLGAEVVGQPLQILRSDGSWYRVTIEAFVPADGTHLLRFYDGDGRPVSSRPYDLNHPSRKLKWYDPTGKLLAVGTGPVLTASHSGDGPHTSPRRRTASSQLDEDEQRGSQVVWSRGSGSATPAAPASASSSFYRSDGGGGEHVGSSCNGSSSTRSNGGSKRSFERHRSVGAAAIAPASSAHGAELGGSGDTSTAAAAATYTLGNHHTPRLEGAATNPAATTTTAVAPARRTIAADTDGGGGGGEARIVRVGAESFSLSELRSGCQLLTSTASSARRFVRLRARTAPISVTASAVAAASAASSAGHQSPFVGPMFSARRSRGGTAASDDASTTLSLLAGSFSQMTLPDSARLPPSARDAPATPPSAGAAAAAAGAALGLSAAVEGRAHSSGGTATTLSSATGGKLVRVFAPQVPQGRPFPRPLLPPPAEGWKAKQVRTVGAGAVWCGVGYSS